MSFADSFWTQNYASGIDVLFGELRQGIKENEDFIQLFSKRMEIEYIYGTELEALPSTMSKTKSSRNENDDFVSTMKNAFSEVNENFAKQGEVHLQAARNINHMVIEPFTKWCSEHKERVNFSYDSICEKYNEFKTAKSNLEKLQKKYFNRCRMLEEFKSHYTEEELREEIEDLKFSKENLKNEDQDDCIFVYVLGEKEYSSESMKELLTRMLRGIELSSHKVPILGTYQNVSNGGSITQWLLDNQPEIGKNILKAEKFGQDMLSNGFIRQIGTMGSGKNFINSSQYYYQWRPEAFKICGLPENNVKGNDSTVTPNRSANFSDIFIDMKQALGVPAVDFQDKSQLSKLLADVDVIDHDYFNATVALDKLRCILEETIMDHLVFMQKCELDRLKAVKKATFDFISSFSNRMSSIKKLFEELVLLEETINPINDLKFLVENYGTGRFKPHVILYDNYYNSNINQTFGVDLATKCRLERKVVPSIIQCTLSFLDKTYPEMSDDKERINLWTQPVHLSKIHELRFRVNSLSDSEETNRQLETSEPQIVTNLLKLYLMELPDSIIPSESYDVIKSLYQNYPPNSDDQDTNDSRIKGLQNVLIDLPKCNLATLDAILTHLHRLVKIIGTKDKETSKELKSSLSREFGTLLSRTKADSWGTVKTSHSSEKYQQAIVDDLFSYKEVIFNELRRRSSTRAEKKSQGNIEAAGDPRRVLNSKNRLENKLKKAVNGSPSPSPSLENKLRTESEEESRPLTEGDENKPVLVSNKSSNDKSKSTLSNKIEGGAGPQSLEKLNSPENTAAELKEGSKVSSGSQEDDIIIVE